MLTPFYGAKRSIILCFLLLFCLDSFAAKRNFKGLFGSYRRPKYVENEARSSAFGINLHLSSLIPVSPIVKSTATRGADGDTLHFATFFNVEAEFFLTLSYKWQVFVRFGHMSYETRKLTEGVGSPTQPIFHVFKMTTTPVLGGVRYRFSREDVVPYVGLGVGAAYTQRHVGYDSSALGESQYFTHLVGDIHVGAEFYFASNAGLRLEVGAFYMKIPEGQYDHGGSPVNNPIFSYQGNPWTMRYASGIFILF